MALLYRTSDRLKLKVDDIVVHLSPLSYLEKAMVEEEVRKGTTIALTTAAAMAVKYAVKGVENVFLPGGEEFFVELDEEGKLTDQCVSDLLNLQMYDKLISISLNLLNGVPKRFTNMETGQPISGVSFVEEDSEKKP